MEKVIRDLCGIKLCLSDVWTFHVDNKLPFLKPDVAAAEFHPAVRALSAGILWSISGRSTELRSLASTIGPEALEREIDLVLRLYASRTIKSLHRLPPAAPV